MKGEGGGEDQRSDEHEAVDEFGVFGSEGEGDGAAQGMAEDVAAAELKGSDDVGNYLGEGFGVVVIARWRGFFAFAEAW